VGLITYLDVNRHDTYQLVSEPKYGSPDPKEMSEFILQLTKENQDKLDLITR